MSNNVKPFIPEYTTATFIEIWDEASKFVYDYSHVGIPATISTTNATTLYYLLYARYGNSPIANYDVEQFKYKMFSVIFQYGPTWEKRLGVQETLRGLNLSDLINDGALNELFNHSGQNGVTESTTGSLNKSTDVNVTGTDDSTTATNNMTTSTGTQTVAHTGTVGVLHDNDIQNSGNDTTVTNHAFNPSTTPAVDAYSPLTYVNEQSAQKATKGTKSEQDETSTTTYNNTDTTTNNLQGTNTTNQTVDRDTTEHTVGQEASNSTGSKTISGNDSAADTRSRMLTKGTLDAYEHLLRLLDSDVTGEFLAKFSICFKQFVFPEHPLLFITEVEDDYSEE